MDIRELQAKINGFSKLWNEKQNRSPSEQITFNHIVEELGELASQYVNKDIRKEKFSGENLDNAIGDLLVHIIELASIRNIDIETLLLEIIEKDKERVQ